MPALINGKVTYKGGEALPNVNSSAYLAAQNGEINPVNSYTGYNQPDGSVYYPSTGSYSAPPIPKTITSDLISGNGQPYTVPNLPKSNVASGIIESTTSLNNSSKVLSEAERAKQLEIAKTQGQQGDIKSLLASTLNDLGLQGANRIKAEENAGIPDLQKQKDEIDSQIEAEQLSAQRQIENLDKTFSGTTAGKNDAINQIQKESARKLADLSIIQNARNRNLLTAQSLVDKKIQLETEDLKTKAEGLKFFYNENKDFLDKEDQRAFDTATKKADREYQEAYDSKKKLEDTKLKLLTSASEQGASNQILSSIQNAKSEDDAIIAAGKYGGDILAKRIQEANLENIQSQIDARKTEGGKEMTAVQAQASGYADRMINSNKIIESFGNKFGSAFAIGEGLPNFAKSADRQKFEQAQRDFVNAVLRKESGAAISDGEFASAKQQYFPQPGDSDAVIEQKRINRLISTNSLLKQAGLPTVPIASVDTSPTQFKLPTGQIVTKQPDGTYK